jgi:hypothetical protein
MEMPAKRYQKINQINQRINPVFLAIDNICLFIVPRIDGGFYPTGSGIPVKA